MKLLTVVTLIKIMLTLFCILPLSLANAAAAKPDTVPLTLEASYSRQAFSPERGDSVTFRYNVSKPATLSLFITGPDGREWYSETHQASQAGRGEFVWKGISNKKINVPAEAYRYHLSATHAGETVTTHNKHFTGGVVVDVTQISLNTADKTISYFLRQPARVRVLARLVQGSVPLGTQLDWAVRPAGFHSEPIALDKFTDLFGDQPIMPIVQAWALPPDSIIVLPKTSQPNRDAFFAFNNKPAGTIKPWFDNLYDTSLVQHATHAYDRCYDPRVVITPPESMTMDQDKWQINKAVTVSFNAAKDQGVGRITPIPRLSLFVFVDDVMVTRLMPAYLPYQWKLDPANYVAGDHVVTLMLSWRDDHIGVTHQKITIAPEVAKLQKD